MFKKRANPKKKGRNIRKSGGDTSDGEEPSDPHQQKQGTTELIDQVKKKRRLLTALQTKRGVDSTELVQASRSVAANASEKSEDAAAAAEASSEGILDQKHRKAMESYVANRLATADVDAKNKPNGKPLATEHALYSEVAASAMQLSGKANERAANDDAGSGGAVLVAGTGIAEVILPAEDRLKLQKETEMAKAARYHRRKDEKLDPAPSRPQAIPNRFAVQQPPPAADPPDSQAEEDESAKPPAAVDDGRVGFEALYQRQHGLSGERRQPKHRSSDHRVYQNFVTRQREMKK